LSVGLQPVERFPSWIRPFVRDQPTSQYVYALHAWAGDSTPGAGVASWSVIGPAVLWPVSVIVILTPLHALVASRRR
jgi:ABC-2 type transport system permease protein